MNGKIRTLDIDIYIKADALNFIADMRSCKTPMIFPVVGDFIIDRYRYCKVERKNLEHDSLIHDLVKTEYHYGGAANVANIIGTLLSCMPSATAEFFFGCGKGDTGYLKKVGLYKPSKFKINAYIDSRYDRVIPVKTRYIGLKRNEYLFRVDAEPTREEFPELSYETISDMFYDIDTGSNSIFVSDYNKGFISSDVIDQLCSFDYAYCNLRPKTVLQHATKTFLSFNLNEFLQSYELATKKSVTVLATDHIEEFMSQLTIGEMIITCGSSGFIYKSRDNGFIQVESMKSLSVGSKNIIGAGDMVAASYAVFDIVNRMLNDKYKKDIILYLVNCAAFLKVYTGQYTVDIDMIESLINGDLCLF